MPKILLVEDDVSLAKLVRFTLQSERCVMDHAADVAAALLALKTTEYDALILDWCLPDGTGLELCKHFRSSGGTQPIMMLTARYTSVEKVEALSAGADDFVVKPFDPAELAARVKALLRRPPLAAREVLRFRNIELDKSNFWVKKDGAEVALQPKEFAILQLLMEHPDKYFSAEAILARVWRSDLPVSTDSVRTLVKSLRKKLGDVIENSRGHGYRMNTHANE